MEFFNIIGIQNQFPYRFGAALTCNNVLKVRNSTPTNNNFKFYYIANIFFGM